MSPTQEDKALTSRQSHDLTVHFVLHAHDATPANAHLLYCRYSACLNCESGWFCLLNVRSKRACLERVAMVTGHTLLTMCTVAQIINSNNCMQEGTMAARHDVTFCIISHNNNNNDKSDCTHDHTI